MLIATRCTRPPFNPELQHDLRLIVAEPLFYHRFGWARLKSDPCRKASRSWSNAERECEQHRGPEGRGRSHVIPDGPARKIPSPEVRRVFVRWSDSRQGLVARLVAEPRDPDRADHVQRRADQRVGAAGV